MINRVGYTIHKLPPAPRKTSEVVEMVVAGKTIKVHGGNPLKLVYQQNPDCNGLMTYAAMAIKEKYPTAWAVDAGANIGDTLAIIRSKADLPIICVEGDVHCYKLLDINACQFDRVHIFNLFLSEHPVSTIVNTDKDGWNTTLTESTSATNGHKITFETLDNLAKKLKCLPLIKFIKVDTEGYDMRILKGADTTLTSGRPVITFELNKENIEPLGDSVPDFFEYLIKKGFNHFLLLDPNGKSVCVLGAQDQNVFSSLYKNSGPGGFIYYFDIWAFHQDDEDIFMKIMKWQETLF